MAVTGQYYGDQVNVAAINGRDFAGVKLAATTQGGEVIIRAARAWVWTEGSSSGARIIGNDGLPIGTQRIVLQGDVSIELAGHRFTAPQAVLWSQTLAVPAIAFGDPPPPPRRIRTWRRGRSRSSSIASPIPARRPDTRRPRIACSSPA